MFDIYIQNSERVKVCSLRLLCAENRPACLQKPRPKKKKKYLRGDGPTHGVQAVHVRENKGVKFKYFSDPIPLTQEYELNDKGTKQITALNFPSLLKTNV